MYKHVQLCRERALYKACLLREHPLHFKSCNNTCHLIHMALQTSVQCLRNSGPTPQSQAESAARSTPKIRASLGSMPHFESVCFYACKHFGGLLVDVFKHDKHAALLSTCGTCLKHHVVPGQPSLAHVQTSGRPLAWKAEGSDITHTANSRVLAGFVQATTIHTLSAAAKPF